MSIQSTGLSTTGMVNSGGFVANPVAQIPQATPVEIDLPKTEAKPASSGVGLLQDAVDQANKVFDQIQSDVQFVFDKDSNKVVVKLVEQGTGVVINQYPTDHALAISKAISQMQQQTADLHAVFKTNYSGLQGLLFKQKS